MHTALGDSSSFGIRAHPLGMLKIFVAEGNDIWGYSIIFDSEPTKFMIKRVLIVSLAHGAT